MAGSAHIDLAVEGAAPGRTQPVEVTPLGDDEYLVLYSPGLVEGIAAGDTVRLLDVTLGTFEVVRHGRNLSIKFACSGSRSLTPVIEEISRALLALDGRLDGAIHDAAVWTVPVSSGFAPIEAIMDQAKARAPGSGWWYGNVYDAAGKPLRWWEGEVEP